MGAPVFAPKASLHVGGPQGLNTEPDWPAHALHKMNLKWILDLNVNGQHIPPVCPPSLRAAFLSRAALRVGICRLRNE